MEKKEIEKSRKGIEKCAKWLSDCLSFGWQKHELDRLEEIFWMYRDKDGELLPADQHRQSQSLSSVEGVSDEEIKSIASAWALKNADETMETNSALNRGFIGGFKKCLEMRNKLQVSDAWISVEEKPDTDLRVMVYSKREKGRKTYESYFYKDNIKGYEFQGDIDVTHWMPLPTPPNH